MNDTAIAFSPRATLPPCVHDAIDLIVQHAKVDRHGAYWPASTAFRGANADSIPLSLGYGTSGILLTLLEFHRHTEDREIAELVQRGIAWVQQRLTKEGVSHGLYLGTPGIWYLLQRCEGEFPGMVDRWQPAAIDALRGAKPAIAASMAAGCAGTIAGVLGGLELPGDECARIVHPLRQRLSGLSAIAENGVHWDWTPTSMQAPLGYLFGNAGVEYALAHAALVLGERYTSAILGSLARASALYDRPANNWPDFETAPGLREADQAAIDRILDAVENDVVETCRPVFSFAWGSGTAGILLGRVALETAFADSEVAPAARAQSMQAVQALERMAGASHADLDGSIQHGWAGIALACDAAARRNASIGDRLVRMAELCRARLSETMPASPRGDLSLLTGIAGAAYALMVDRNEASCVDPLANPSRDSGQPSFREVSARESLALRMPACAALDSVATGLNARPITLAAVAELAGLMGSAPIASDVAQACRQREVDMQQALARTNFRERFWRELAAKRRYARAYGEGLDDNVLFGCFRIDRAAMVIALQFDPATRTPLPAGESVEVLRLQCSTGIIEAKLSSLQAALLREFGDGAVTLQAIGAVIDRVQTPDVTQRQLATLALRLVRGFIQGGQLVPVKTGALRRWVSRRQLEGVRRNLFPVAGA
jgi:hypothetical protein